MGSLYCTKCGAVKEGAGDYCETCSPGALPAMREVSVPVSGRGGNANDPAPFDPFALTSTIFGAVGLFAFLPVVFGPIALALGAVGLTRTSPPVSMRGKWMAVLGVLFGLTTVLVSAHQVRTANDRLQSSIQEIERLFQSPPPSFE